MNQEILWLAQRIEELRDSARQARWHFEELQESRRELNPVWNDSCATEMSRRFLEPMAEDATTSLGKLGAQIVQLEACVASLWGADTSLLKAAAASIEVRAAISETESLFRALDSLFSQVIDEATQASLCSARASKLISRANAAGS